MSQVERAPRLIRLAARGTMNISVMPQWRHDCGIFATLLSDLCFRAVDIEAPVIRIAYALLTRIPFKASDAARLENSLRICAQTSPGDWNHV